MDIPSPDSAPAALADLIAAGLVSHEMIGDPGRLAGEAEALQTLCGLVSGSVWRIEPFHYAFRVGPGDLGSDLGGDRGGACDDQGVDAQATALEGALQAALGADAVWVNAADLVPTGHVADRTAGARPFPDAPLLLLHAGDEARRATLEVAGPDAQAVIGARFALAAARLAAGLGEEGRLAERLTAIETRQAAILAALEAGAVRAGHARSEQDAALDRLAQAIAFLAARIDTATARSEPVGETVAGTMVRAAEEMAAFRETVGLTLAEFLAGIERRAEQDRGASLPVRIPQFS